MEMLDKLDLNADDDRESSNSKRSSPEKENSGSNSLSQNSKKHEKDELDEAVEELLDISMPRNS